MISTTSRPGRKGKSPWLSLSLERGLFFFSLTKVIFLFLCDCAIEGGHTRADSSHCAAHPKIPRKHFGLVGQSRGRRRRRRRGFRGWHWPAIVRPNTSPPEADHSGSKVNTSEVAVVLSRTVHLHPPPTHHIWLAGLVAGPSSHVRKLLRWRTGVPRE